MPLLPDPIHMVMARQLSYLISQSRNIVRPWWLRQSYHNTPDLLHTQLQSLIDQIEQENETLVPTERFDQIVLAYGLCSNSVIGLCSRSLPIVLPRCDDCIALLLGSAERYQHFFQKLPGTYWYTTGWIEQGNPPCRARYERDRAQYVELYGEENAEYLMEHQNHWLHNYQNCGYITCPLGDLPEHIEFAKQVSRDFGWTYQEIPGDLAYLSRLINGPWEDDQFLVCPPHSKIEDDYTAQKFHSIPWNPETTGA